MSVLEENVYSMTNKNNMFIYYIYIIGCWDLKQRLDCPICFSFYRILTRFHTRVRSSDYTNNALRKYVCITVRVWKQGRNEKL